MGHFQYPIHTFACACVTYVTCDAWEISKACLRQLWAISGCVMVVLTISHPALFSLLSTGPILAASLLVEHNPANSRQLS